MAQNNRAVGTEYEKQAEQFLKKQGVRIIVKNFRCRQGEIDIVGTDGGCLVFFEVKYRRNKMYSSYKRRVTAGTS